ncbi:MAG: 4a-hydroxytetrahydrobiopterin dehydratase [Candidatus Yonathbacteria bacterium]|nr:4a-hydroxytetrahydrobiopterin dehydratase [Candidatus Yonathbacteria bacterium]
MEQETDLTKKKCVPCEGGTPPLKLEEVATYIKLLKTPWHVEGNKKIFQQFNFKDFKEAVAFVNNIAEIANTEDHHPDIHVYYNKVYLELFTHSICGLSGNDFIVARKIEEVLDGKTVEQ